MIFTRDITTSPKSCCFRGEDEITRERMESCRSDNERRHRAASASEASGAFEQIPKSRTSSSSSQETAPTSSGRGTRGHSAHASSPSPSSSRRNTVASTVDKSQISPSLEYEQRTARSLTGSLSSPSSSSHRPSRNLSTAQAIALAASTASSPMFQQTSSGPSGPHSTSSTVINVTGEQRKLSSKDGQIKTTSNLPEGDTSTIKLGPTNNTLVGNTHIIKVSGPVTNLDETVLSAVGMEGMLMTSSISENSTTSTASGSSSMAPVIDTREVLSSPIPSSLSSTLAYDFDYNTSPDKQSLKSSVLEYSTNDSIYEAITDPKTISQSSISMANISSDTRSVSHSTISESRHSPPPIHSLSTSDLSENQNNKNQNISLSSTIPILPPPTSTSSNESAPSSNPTTTTTPHESPKASQTKM